MRKSQQRGYNYEKVKAHQRGYPQGGPGSPDYVKGGRKGEVKRWARPVDRSTLIKLARKGINEVVSKKDLRNQQKNMQGAET